MHIGKMIQREFKKSGMTAQDFADALSCHRQNVYKIFEKPDISSYLLWRISIILNYDFFAEIAKIQGFVPNLETVSKMETLKNINIRIILQSLQKNINFMGGSEKP